MLFRVIQDTLHGHVTFFIIMHNSPSMYYCYYIQRPAESQKVLILLSRRPHTPKTAAQQFTQHQITLVFPTVAARN